MQGRRFDGSQLEFQGHVSFFDFDKVVSSLRFNFPILILYEIAVHGSPCLVTIATARSLPEVKFFRLLIGKRKMGHVEIGKERGIFLLFALPVAQAKAKECHLIAVALTAFSFQMACVVPPFGLEIRMGEMILGKGEFPSRQSGLISEGRGKKKGRKQRSDDCSAPESTKSRDRDLR